MFSWGQTLVLVVAVFVCCTTIAICDITIIKEIKKLRKTLRKFSALLIEEEKDEE